jgi:serine/threonine protein phosphatase PrpC
MRIDARWLSQQGTRTPENRDHAGVGARPGEFLGIVVDGSTAGATNGDYARAVVELTIDWFAQSDDEWTIELASEAVREIHRSLTKQFQKGSASLLLVHVTDEGKLTALHSGDCVLGQLDGDIAWLNTPHTFANALIDANLRDIARSPLRHLLTQSFRTREFMLPEAFSRENAKGTFVLASDGFWAELSDADQIAFIAGDLPTNPDRDDRSLLLLRLSPEVPFTVALDERSAANFHTKILLG